MKCAGRARRGCRRAHTRCALAGALMGVVVGVGLAPRPLVCCLCLSPPARPPLRFSSPRRIRHPCAFISPVLPVIIPFSKVPHLPISRLRPLPSPSAHSRPLQLSPVSPPSPLPAVFDTRRHHPTHCIPSPRLPSSPPPSFIALVHLACHESCPLH